MTSVESTPSWETNYKVCIKDHRRFYDEQILTNYKPVDITNYTISYTPPRGTAVRLEWNGVAAYCRDGGYITRYEDDVFKGVYCFDRDTGYYRPVTVDQFETRLLMEIGEAVPAYVFPATFRALVEKNLIPKLPRVSEQMGTSPEFEAIRSFYKDRELIPFRNGIYSVQDNALLPRTSFVFIEHPLDVDFDPSALDDEVSERFMEMMCGDQDLFELLFEQLGYAMYARSFIVPTVTIFYGSGANGKSVVLDLVNRIVGERNISTLSMYDMTNAFALASSEGKLLNLSTDSSAGPGDTMIATANTAEFMKKSTTGEQFEFNPKHGQLHKGYGPRKFLFATNVMLKFGGIDEGLARRIYAIPFNARFEEDYRMKVLLTSEKTKRWFAMQALVSLGSMIHRRMGGDMFTATELSGEYITCQSSERMKTDQLAAQDTVLDWLSDEMELDIMDPDEVREALLGQPNLFESYSYFCGATRRPAKSRRAFHNTMRSRYAISFRRTCLTKGAHSWVAVKAD